MNAAKRFIHGILVMLVIAVTGGLATGAATANVATVAPAHTAITSDVQEGISAPVPAATSYWCERTLTGSVGIIRCGGKTPTAIYRVNVTCNWLNIHTYKLIGPQVTVKSGKGSGKVCHNADRAVAVKAEWL